MLDGLVDAARRARLGNCSRPKLLQLTMPGVPDVYQGSELWEHSLVDPDNRRPSTSTCAGVLAARRSTSRPTPQAALVTAARCGCAATGPSCSPPTPRCRPTGPAADHVLAFDRGGAVTVATRLPVGLAARGGWGDTACAARRAWRDVLDRPPVRDRGAASPTCSPTYPVALLVRRLMPMSSTDAVRRVGAACRSGCGCASTAPASR